MIWLALGTVILMLVAAVAVLLLENMLAATAAASVVSLGVALLFVLLQAPDVAMTEAAVGAGLSSLILALGLNRVGLWRVVNTQAGYPELGRDVGRVLAVALGFAVVDDAAALGRGNAEDEVEVILLCQRHPPVDHVAVVLRRRGEPGTVLHTVVIEEHAKDLVPLFQCGLGEMVGRVGRLVLIGPLVYLDCQFHDGV